MGWASGSYLAEEIWTEVRDFIPEDKCQKVARYIHDKFCDHDADDWDGNSQLEIDAGVNQDWNPDEQDDYIEE